MTDLSASYVVAGVQKEIRALEKSCERMRFSKVVLRLRMGQEVYLKLFRRLLEQRRLLRRLKAALQPAIARSPRDAMHGIWDFTKDMRFGPREIEEIARALLPEKVAARDRNGHIIVSTDNVIALGVVLYHLATPSRQDRQASFWGRSVSWVSQIFHATLDILFDIAMVVFRRWPESHLKRVKIFCDAMYDKSRQILHAHALMDGSGLFVCRPSRENTQQHYYSGAEGGHVLRIVAVLSLSLVCL